MLRMLIKQFVEPSPIFYQFYGWDQWYKPSSYGCMIALMISSPLEVTPQLSWTGEEPGKRHRGTGACLASVDAWWFRWLAGWASNTLMIWWFLILVDGLKTAVWLRSMKTVCSSLLKPVPEQLQSFQARDQPAEGRHSASEGRIGKAGTGRESAKA